MKYLNKKAVLGFMLAAFLCAQGTGLVPAAEEAGELVLECTEESEILEEGEEAAGEEDEADAGEEKPAEQGEPAPGEEKPAEEPEAADETDEAAKKAGSPAETGSFTDANGITYDWKACGDGTAEVTGFSFTEAEPVIAIPETIGGYPVTAITGSIRNAAICELVIPETITYLGDNVFTDNEIGVLRYNAADADNAQNFFQAPFAGCRVREFPIGGNVEVIRGYTFYNTVFCEAETVLDVPEIETYAFCGASFEKLVLPGGTVAIGKRAFAEADIQFLSYHCPDARLQADSTAFGPFYLASIHGLEFSDDVRTIPDYLFSNADMKFSEFSFGQERIGDYAFYGAWDALGFVTGADIAEAVTIGEGVVYLGKNAFGGCRVGELHYLANAACGAGSMVNGPFYLAEIGRITVGEAVESIPEYLFANARFTEAQNLYLDVPVGDGAFYSGYETGTSFGELTIGGNVGLLGNNAFSGRNIANLAYLAEEAKTACTQTGEAPFYSCQVGKFVIGEKVASIDAAVFGGMYVSQEELVIPDSVRKIGSYAFYGTVRDTYEPFGTLRVGSGLEELAGTAFAGVSFMDVYVEALGAAKEPDAGKEPGVDAGEELDIYPGDLPSAENLFIHRGSDFYPFYSTNAAHITLYCDDYMIGSEGERCWDEESGRYVAPRYETCSVCGYRNVFYVYEDGTEDKPEPEKDSGQNSEDKQEVNPEKKSDPEEESESKKTPDPEKKPDPEEKPDPEKKEDSGQGPGAEKALEPEKKPDSEKKEDSEQNPEAENTPEPESKENPETEKEPERKEDSERTPEESPEIENKAEQEKKQHERSKQELEEKPKPEASKKQQAEQTSTSVKRIQTGAEAAFIPARRPDAGEDQEGDQEENQTGKEETKEQDGSTDAKPAPQAGRSLCFLLIAGVVLGFGINRLCVRRQERKVILIIEIRTVP